MEVNITWQRTTSGTTRIDVDPDVVREELGYAQREPVSEDDVRTYLDAVADPEDRLHWSNQVSEMNTDEDGSDWEITRLDAVDDPAERALDLGNALFEALAAYAGSGVGDDAAAIRPVDVDNGGRLHVKFGGHTYVLDPQDHEED